MRLASGTIVLAGLAAYANTFSVPFLFDDLPSIQDNPSLASLKEALLRPPNGYGLTVAGRPVLNFSLAINHALSGTNVWSYHALNVVIHLLAGLTLFGIVRRTLAGLVGAQGCQFDGFDRLTASKLSAPSLPAVSLANPSRGCAHPEGRGKPAPLHADELAFVVALLWTLHPLQTEAVTYIIQRAESLMGLFFLLTLYCFIRGIRAVGADVSGPLAGRAAGDFAQGNKSRAGWHQAHLQIAGGSGGLPDVEQASQPASPITGRCSRWLWHGLAVLSCLLGMATKEVMAVAPVLVWLYDRTFVTGAFREAWRRHRWFHLSLAATWLPLVGLMAAAGWNRGGTSGFGAGVVPGDYWLTQFDAVTRYLSLAFWPHPLVFEYGTVWVRLGAVIPQILLVATLAAATLVALWRQPVVGFLGVWFFAILAPTSLVPGTIQMIVEHRMYLPLAAVLALLVGSVAVWCGRTGLVALLVLAVAAGVVSYQRNSVYRTDLDLWEDTVAKCPASANAQSNLGTALFARGRSPEALAHYERSLHLNPALATTHYNLALALIRAGRLAEAAAHCRETFRLNPRYYQAHFQLGMVLVRLDRIDEALGEFARALEIAPWFGDAHFQSGLALGRMGRWPEAVAHHEGALRLDPDNAATECGLGVALFQSGRGSEAAAHFERALRLNPKLMEAHFNLGQVLALMGRPDQAVAHYAEAVRLDSNNADAQINLGIALAEAGKLPEAVTHLERAVQLRPDLPEAHANLGIALAQQGRWEDAIRHYQEALRIKPAYAEAHYNLGNALLQSGRIPEARAEFEAALRIRPQFDAARDMLNRIAAFESSGGQPSRK